LFDEHSELRYLLERISVKPFKGSKNRTLLVFLGLLGDLDSFEYVQRLRPFIPTLDNSRINVHIIGIGNNRSKDKFCSFTKLEKNYLEVIEDVELYSKLDLCKGLNLKLGGVIDLILMCIGISSPGTLREVLRGYTGDRRSDQIFKYDENIYTEILPSFKGVLFDNACGEGFLRPFELATLRLGNMVEVLTNWDIYMLNNQLLTQRGATYLIDKDDKLIYSYKAKSLLAYSESMSQPLAFLDKYLDES